MVRDVYKGPAAMNWCVTNIIEVAVMISSKTLTDNYSLNGAFWADIVLDLGVRQKDCSITKA